MQIPCLQQVLCWLAMLLALLVKSGHGIGCFLCHSLNNSNVACHDPFHPAHNIYEPVCMQGKRGVQGVFPTNYCVKIAGRRMRDDVYLVIRRCVIERFTETDHKIGLFRWEGDLYEGIIGTCKSAGCNPAPSDLPSTMTTLVTIATSLVLLLLWKC